MFTTAIISFREFLEAFLITGIFLGVSKKMQLKKELEILLAAVSGIVFSLILTTSAFLLNNFVHSLLTEKNIDSLESYILIFSGIFMGYVIISLHKTLQSGKDKMFRNIKNNLEKEIFDISLFLTIMFMVIREGFEIAIFATSVSVFSAFSQNLIGLVIGFLFSFFLAIITFFVYTRFPVKKIFQYTEYIIILFGASLLQNGITKLLDTHFSVVISNVLPLPFGFLPDEDTMIGHFLQSLLGIDNKFSIARLFIMIIYAVFMYIFILKPIRKKKI